MKRTHVALLMALLASAAGMSSAQSSTDKPVFTVLPPHPVSIATRLTMSARTRSFINCGGPPAGGWTSVAP